MSPVRKDRVMGLQVLGQDEYKEWLRAAGRRTLDKYRHQKGLAAKSAASGAGAAPGAPAPPPAVELTTFKVFTQPAEVATGRATLPTEMPRLGQGMASTSLGALPPSTSGTVVAGSLPSSTGYSLAGSSFAGTSPAPEGFLMGRQEDEGPTGLDINSGVRAGSGTDQAMVDMLLAQVEALMRDKAALSAENAGLRQQVEQLTELLWAQEHIEMTKGGSSRGRTKSQGSDDAKEARSPARHSLDRRPLRFWQPFNDWWRSTFEKKEGRRPDAQEITVWYNEHAASLWKEDAPSLQETRIHAKCLRSLPLVRDYFRNYRARKRSVSDRLLAAPALLSPTTAALLAVHRAGLEAADGAGGGAGAGAGLPGDLLQRLAMQAAAVQQQFALAALAHNLAASQRAAATGAVEEEASGGVRGCGDAGGTENGTLSPRSSKRQRTAAAAAALGGEGPNGAETGAGGAGAEQPGWLGSRRLLHTEAEPSVEVAAPGGRSRAAGSWRGGGGDSRQGGPSKRRGQHAGGGSGPAGQEPLDEDSLAGLNGLAVAALELSGMGLAEPGGVLLPPPLELLHVPPALSLEPMGREALQVLGREQLVDRVLLLQAHLQLATQQQQQPQAELRLQAAGSEGAALGAGAGGLPMASPATRLLQALPAGMSPGQKLNAILAQEGLLPGPVAAMASAGPAGLGVPLPLMPQVKQQPLEQQSLLKEQEAAAVRAVGQQTPPRPAEVRSPVRLEQKPAEDRPSSTAAAATTTVDMGVSDAGNAAAAGGAVAGGDDESMGDPAPSDADEAHLQGGGGAPEVASAPTAVVA
eukprot:XP_001690344.1 predicted protein [Chlamydomonas reinhardtii]